jgi:hypothetical protein
MVWECKVSINNIPTVMRTEAPNYLLARGYFLTFGKLLTDPRIIE